MKEGKYQFFIFVNLMILFNSFNSYYLAQTKQNSIINLFCIENFKEEMLKANINYEQEIAKETCDCYLKEFINTNSHQKAISKCKFESKMKFNL